MEAASKFSQAIRVTRAAFSTTRVRVLAILTPLLAYVGMMSDGFQSLTWLKANWGWVISWSQSPYFLWGLCAALALIFWSGVRSGVRRLEKGELERSDLYHQTSLLQLAGIREGTAVANHLALAYLSQQRIIQLEDLHAKARSALGEYRNIIDAYRQGTAAIGSAEVNHPFHDAMQKISMALLDAEALGIEHIEPHRKITSKPITDAGPPGAHYRIFDTAHKPNSAFITEHDQNWEQQRLNVQRIEFKIRAVSAELLKVQNDATSEAQRISHSSA